MNCYETEVTITNVIHTAIPLYNITSGYKVTSGLGFAQRPDVLFESVMTENALIFWSVLYYFDFFLYIYIK